MLSLLTLFALSFLTKGRCTKKHLQGGVKKGAFTQEEADKKFEEWLAAKDSKIQTKVDGLAKKEATDAKARLAAEVEVKNKRAEELAAKNAPAEEEAPAEEAPAVEATEEAAAPEATEEKKDDAAE